MTVLFLCFAISWLLQLAVASGDLVDLVPLPRHAWDPTIHIDRRDEATVAANVTLMDHEEMLWTSPPNDTHPKIVSMVVWTGQDRLILDMAKFGWELKTVNCTQNMMVEFRHNISFQAAKKQWDWVNFNGMRSFVMIADHIKCGKDWSPNPWLISDVRFDSATLKVFMDATKKTWKNITHSYSMDFGEVTQTRNKRFLDYNLDKAFTLDLTSTFPSKILAKKWTSGNAKASFGVDCVGCGTSGALVFAGHIEGSVFGGIDKFMISATPQDLQAQLNIQATFEGLIKFKNNKEEFDLLTIPLPYGWTIPGVLTFGPNAKVIAGYSLDAVEGAATVTTGVIAKIPADSIAKVDLFQQKKLDVHGWVPTFQVQPLQIQAEITAGATLYTKLAVAVSIDILDENGVNVDVNLQFPKFIITATGGYNEAGFCPNNADTFGVSLEVSLGVELELEGWAEIDGNRKTLFDVDLYQNDNLYDFPTLCLGLGGKNDASSCAYVPPDEDYTWWWNEVAQPEAFGLAKRATKDPFTMKCDENKEYKIRMKPYKGPKELGSLRGQTPPQASIPLLQPGFYNCGDENGDNCVVEYWKLTIDPPSDVFDYAKISTTLWNAEHIYEGDWIKEFLNYLHETYFESGVTGGCLKLATIFGISSGSTNTWMSDLMTQLGNNKNYDRTMTLFTSKENGLKHRIFDPGQSVDNIFSENPSEDVKLCRVARIVNACKYMMEAKTQEGLLASLVGGYTIGSITYEGVDGVFGRMDAAGDTLWTDAGMSKPSNFPGWAAVHKTWFKKMYADGINVTRKGLKEYARILVEDLEYDDDADTVTALTEMKDSNLNAATSDMDKYCADNLSWA